VRLWPWNLKSNFWGFKITASHTYWPCDLDLWPFNPNHTISRIFQVLTLWDRSFLCYASDKQTDKQTNTQTNKQSDGLEHPTHAILPTLTEIRVCRRGTWVTFYLLQPWCWKNMLQWCQFTKTDDNIACWCCCRWPWLSVRSKHVQNWSSWQQGPICRFDPPSLSSIWAPRGSILTLWRLYRRIFGARQSATPIGPTVFFTNRTLRGSVS